MKHTYNAFLDTLDFIKRMIYLFDLLFQILYLGYLAYRIIFSSGFYYFNIALAAVSFGYFIYHLASTKEFYTLEQSENRRKTKLVFTAIKRVINLLVIGLSVYEVITSTNSNNIDLLITFVMVLGYMFLIFGDIIVNIINAKIKLILNAARYDLDKFREEHLVATGMINSITKKMNIDIKTLDLKVDEKMLAKIKRVNYKQEIKARRKKDYKKSQQRKPKISKEVLALDQSKEVLQIEHQE